ncbi:hypothetical protein BN1723_015015 [Verticillium longisporum]|uniref:K Homology domain-containing protein n=1 Tax=Verticillium longisporum TaxID=100787 RepID=A0A0G4MN64_VERLO|nr:hypothetical protein BN1723_015015 [Verticillium longisporum]
MTGSSPAPVDNAPAAAEAVAAVPESAAVPEAAAAPAASDVDDNILPGRHWIAQINDTIHVPSEAVGMIIGKGGETIREMQNNTGCKINVAQSSGPGEVEREIALIGSRESITQAKAAIEEKVDAVRQKSGGGGRDGGGRGRQQQHHDYDNYSQQASNAPAQANAPAAPAPAAADGSDPYAQYGGYQNYLALWYQSLMYQQQQGGSAPPAGGPPAPGAA